jgi:anti-sigma-K factor RskA
MNANEHDHRLEEAAAFALGALDAERIDDFREHLEGCRRCQEEVRWLEPAVRALPEAVEQQSPPPELKVRLMEEVRADLAATAQRAERASSRKAFREWLDRLHIGGLTWKPLAGLAVVILIVAGGIGYAVGTGSGGGNVSTTEREQENGIVAKVVTEGSHGELRLTGVRKLPQGKVLEAWVQRGEEVEPVEALFTPDAEGNATTTIDDMNGVSVVMVTREPEGGTKTPTTKPIAEVPLEG